MVNSKRSLEILCLITGRELAYQKEIALSVQDITNGQREWLRNLLRKEKEDSLEVSAFYIYRRQLEDERNANIRTNRKKLDTLRHEGRMFTPEELLEHKATQDKSSLANCDGIYIIHNRSKDMYYVGQAKKLVDRASQHFTSNPAKNQARKRMNELMNLPEVYVDFRSKDQFSISLLPLENSSLSTLNEFEDNAIRAYDAVAPAGYNRISGNLMDQPVFQNNDCQQAAEFLLEKIKVTDVFWSLTNDKARRKYTHLLFWELVLPGDFVFSLHFIHLLRAYRKANKGLHVKKE